jgi:hypothetical protein
MLHHIEPGIGQGLTQELKFERLGLTDKNFALLRPNVGGWGGELETQPLGR